jgi:hypothetical protein
MPQETNLNTSPYFDDFDATKGYYKTLFNPARPVQARELNTIQSILQNQVEQFGKHVFKEGSVVIPGQLAYENPIFAVEVEAEFNGVPLSLYFDKLKGVKVRGQTTDVTAEIFFLLTNQESERNNYTLYVKYIESGSDFSINKFADGETLLLESPITYGNFTIQTGQGVCNLISVNANSQGSSVSVADGVYFVRGYFVNVSAQTILLEQYSTFPSYKIGFNVIESIVTADEDPSLYDNAQGFSNYAAPGADRFKLELELTKKDVGDLETDSFVEILRVENGEAKYFDRNPQYNIIRDELARRTFDESGDYLVRPFNVFVRESLNDRVGSAGIYYSNQSTVNGNTPSEDKLVYQISSGKAYVKGYDVETISTRSIDIEKPRTTETAGNQTISFNAGNLFVVNNAFGAPSIGIGTTVTIELRDSRIGALAHVGAGNTIGIARIYDFIPESDYVDDTSRLNLRLFDIQTYTKIGINTSYSTNLTLPTHVKGKRSNATGFLNQQLNAGQTEMVLYQVSGTFLENEQIIVNGIDDGRLINNITDYSISDVKSVYSSSGISTFNADLVLGNKLYIAAPGTTFNITAGNAGIATVSAGLQNTFINVVKSGDIISYSNPNPSGLPIYNKVVSVSAGGTNFSITGVTTVSGICDGGVSTTAITVNNVVKIAAAIGDEDTALLTKLNASNIANLSLIDNEIIQRRVFRNNTVSGNSVSISISASDVDVFFEAFDEDRFVITYSNGVIEPMRSDKYSLSLDGKTLTFNGLTIASGTCDIIATVKNLKPSSKQKKFNKVSTVSITNSTLTASGIGTTTLNDGLSFSRVYGTRVQDEEISLNVPDVVRVLAVYESYDSGEARFPTLQLTSFSGTTNTNLDFSVGERIIGSNSGSVGIVIARKDNDKLEYINLNTISFSLNETISGEDSTTTASTIDIVAGSKNITQNYFLDNGQRLSYYDYGRLVRKKNSSSPKGKLKVLFQNYTIDSTDTGEFITVNSYSQENYKSDVAVINDQRLTDFIDIRPRVAPYTTSSFSPFEFSSRNFAADGQYSRYILCPEQNLTLSYSYYLGRIDKILLKSDGIFEIVQGIPSLSPIEPQTKDNTLDIATIILSPYLYNVNQANVYVAKHKRYRMADIALLEDRIKRVEEFSTLTALESKTEKFTIKDADTGLDRFKSGFFVDNFSSHAYHDVSNPSFRTAIDINTNTLRPTHYTTSIDLQLGSEAISGIGQTYNPTVDQSYVTDLGSFGIKKTGDLITLNYNQVLYDQQVYATKSESVTPFFVTYWQGSIQLNPPIDSWIEEKYITTSTLNETVTTLPPIPDENITIINNVNQNTSVNTPPQNTNTSALNQEWFTQGLLPPNTSEINFSTFIPQALSLGLQRQQRRFNSLTTAQVFANTVGGFILPSSGRVFIVQWFIRPNSPPTSGSNNTTITTVIIPPEITTTENTTETISNYTQPVRYLRSRNIEFDIKGLKPRTKFYPFFEGIDVSSYVIPKLLQVTMVSGAFVVGETIESDVHNTSSRIRFRLCTPDHKTGPYNSPTEKFKFIPFDQQSPPSNYSSTSTYLNVDTRALSLPSEVDYYGNISNDILLTGTTSGAVARVTAINLISDNQGRLIGSLFIPNPVIPSNPKWTNGENTFAIIDTPTLDPVRAQEFISNTRVTESSAEENFASYGTSNITENNIVTTRNVTIVPSRRIITTTITNRPPQPPLPPVDPPVNPPVTPPRETRAEQERRRASEQRARDRQIGPLPQTFGRDPLAQSFFVKESSGVFITSVDVYFETKDETVPVTLQLRTMVSGVPSTTVLPFGEVTLDPDQINLSTDSSIPTTFTFPSPVYLSGLQQNQVRQSPIASEQVAEYAIVLLSSSPQYRVFISELGSNDILTGIKLGQQPTLGSLFKSQNSSTWSPAQLEDLKYDLYRANFNNEGLVRFFNPRLSVKNKETTVTGSNQFVTLSKKILVGLGSTGFNSTIIKPGITISQGSATGTLVGIAGSVSTVGIISGGSNYQNGTYTNQSLITNTGFGKNATATVQVSSGVIGTISITNGGVGYQVGDNLRIPDLGNGLGFGGELIVASIASTNTFVIDNVQGTFTVGVSTVSYVNSSGITTTVGAGVTIASITEDQYNTGRHLKVFHANHGMHSSENYVRISGMRPTNLETNSKTTVAITPNSTTISLVSATGFNTFENLIVDGTNPGYVIIGDEVISYTGVTGNTLTGIGTFSRSYASGVPVYKYQVNGISLKRINKIHNFADVDPSIHPIELNSYHIKVETGSTSYDSVSIGKDRSTDLYFNSTQQVGEVGTVLSNNIQFEALTPNIAHIIPANTDIITRVRTFTGTSVGGNEKSFSDTGFVTIPLNYTTYFGAPQLICSDVNEDQFITESPGGRSFTMEFLMSTNDARVSPVIDTIRTNAILTSNLLNNPIGLTTASAYADDDRVRSLYNDPHAAVYISNPTFLQIPANSLKVILSASKNETNDIRILYQLFRVDGGSQYYELFPGYSNYQVDGQGIKRVIDVSRNDGSSDSFVLQTSDRSFQDYEYSVDDLPDFIGFTIKIVMAGTNQATPPLIKDLRAIATVKPRL